jgi:hypothetical protein
VDRQPVTGLVADALAGGLVMAGGTPGSQQRTSSDAGALPVTVQPWCWAGAGELLEGVWPAAAPARTCRREPPVPGLFDPYDPPPTDRSSSGPPTASGDRRLARSGGSRPLEVLDRSFRLLVCEPGPLTLDGRSVGHGLPARPIPLDALRSLLLHPSVDFDARDAALSWLVGRAQAEGGAWLVGLAGVLLPGIGRRVYPLCRAFPRLAHDLEAEALVSLLQAVQAWQLGEDRVATRLVWAAARGAHRLLRRETALGDREASVGLRLEPPPRPPAHGDLLLAQAVRAGVLSRMDAELIAASRVEEIPLRQLAGRWGAGYEALRKRRYRAEAALARWLAAERDVPTEPAAGGLVG